MSTSGGAFAIAAAHVVAVADEMVLQTAWQVAEMVNDGCGEFCSATSSLSRRAPIAPGDISNSY